MLGVCGAPSTICSTHSVSFLAPVIAARAARIIAAETSVLSDSTGREIFMRRAVLTGSRITPSVNCAFACALNASCTRVTDHFGVPIRYRILPFLHRASQTSCPRDVSAAIWVRIAQSVSIS